MRARSFFLSFSLGLVLVGAAACSAETAAPSPTGGTSPPPASTSPVEPAPSAPDGPSEACLSETAALQLALDRTHAADTDAALAVKNESCGLRVLTSGPSKNDASKLHRIGSITKTYVAAVVLGLAAEKKLSLDDAVTKFTDVLAGVPNADVITVRQLLNHTSGLFSYTSDKEFLKEARTRAWTPRELVLAGVRNASYFEPGKGWEYSNTNYVLLGMIAEAAGQGKIGALVRTRVLAKIGATATFFDGEEPVSGTMARGFDIRGNDVTTSADPSWAWAAGAMVATPGDVVTWIEKLGSGAFHDAPTQAALLDTVPTGQSGTSYGLGVFVMGRAITAGAGPAVGHGGDIDGFHCQSFYFTEKKTTLVAVVDSDAEDPNEISLAGIGVLFGAK